MAFLVRKIIRGKWESTWSSIEPEDIPADLITGGELRTQSNTLSVWRIDSIAEFDNAVLAIASGYQSVSGVDVVAIDETELQEVGLRIQPRPSPTPMTCMGDAHYNVCGLAAGTLPKFAACVVRSISQGSVASYPVDAVGSLLRSALSDRLVVRSRMQKSLLGELQL